MYRLAPSSRRLGPAWNPASVAAKVAKVVKKGKTLEQIETEEGGPVKESLVGMAQNRRAAKRKGAMAGTVL